MSATYSFHSTRYAAALVDINAMFKENDFEKGHKHVCSVGGKSCI